MTPWRNGSASDSRSEGCVFKSRRGQKYFFYIFVLNTAYKLLFALQLKFYQKSEKNSLPPMRIELMTFGLQDQRSATQL